MTGDPREDAFGGPHRRRMRTRPPIRPAPQRWGDVVAVRFGRRDLLKGLLGVTAIGAALGPRALAAAPAPDRFPFPELTAPADDTIHVAAGHEPMCSSAGAMPFCRTPRPSTRRLAQTPAAQARQFGYNNDFLGFLPDPRNPDRGLLVVNHEYTNAELMFPGIGPQRAKDGFPGMTQERVDIEMAAHGGSVIGIARTEGRWRVIPVPQARRITATTPMLLSGPAAGDDLLKTADDPQGRHVLVHGQQLRRGDHALGHVADLRGEFQSLLPRQHGGLAARAALKRYGVPASLAGWGKFHYRFDISKTPNEPNRFGWVVEIDPRDPDWTPRKRTRHGPLQA